MNVVELINKVKHYFNTPSVYDGDVYENWNSTEVKYSSINISIENINYNDNNCTYTVLIYYGDRLLQDKSNFNGIVTDGVNAIQSVLNKLQNEYIIDIENSVDYIIFEQKFNDYLAGVYCRVDLISQSTIGECSSEELPVRVLNINSNGDFDVYDYDKVNVDVQLEGKPSSYLTDGYSEYTRDFLDTAVQEANEDYKNFELGATDNHYYYKGFEVPEDLDWAVRTPVASNWMRLFQNSPNLIKYKADWTNTRIYDCSSNITSLFTVLPNLRCLDVTFNPDKIVPFDGSIGAAGLIQEIYLRNLRVSGVIVGLNGGMWLKKVVFENDLINHGAKALSWTSLGNNLEEIEGTIYYSGISLRIDATKLKELRVICSFNHSDLASQRVFFVKLNNTNLSHDSLMFLINNVGTAPAWKTDGYIQLGATNLDKLTDEEKAIAINKGWRLT